MVSEVHELVNAFNSAYVDREALNEMIGQHIALETFVDSTTLFNVIAEGSFTAQRRLQVDIFALRECYKKTNKGILDESLEVRTWLTY